MIQRKKPCVDVVLDILKETNNANPESEFIKSLLFQYQERGGLSKKQLEGLHGKAVRVKNISEAKLATLQAIILKKNAKHRSELPAPKPLYTKDDTVGKMIAGILEKYPEHKRVLFYKTKFDNNETLSAVEKTELERFKKLLIDK
jgi:hypothetical protein